MIVVRRIRANSRWLLAALIVVGLLSVWGCAKSPAPPRKLVTVSLRLPWMYNIEAAGIFVAKERGYYKDEGLDVNIDAGGVGLDPVQLVGGGSNTIGICDGAALIIGRSKGIPVRAIAAEYQHSPLCYVTLAGSGIRRVEDFRGKRIGTQPFQVFVLEAMLASRNMTLKDVKMVPVQFDIRPLTQGQVDAFLSFVTDEPILLDLKGHKNNVIMASDYGYPFYSNVIFATEKTIREQPDVLRRFLRATFRGWRAAFSDVNGTADMVVEKYSRELGKEHQRRGLALLRQIAMGKVGEQGLGAMTADRWEESIQTLLRYKQIERPLPAADVFTTEFAEAVRETR